MFAALKGYFSSMDHTTKKENVIKAAEYAFDNLNDNVIPTLAGAIEGFDFNKSKESGFITTVGRMAGIKYKDANDVIAKIKVGLEGINAERNLFLSTVSSELNTIVTNKTATAKDTAIMKIVNDLNAINSFIMDFIYMLIADLHNTEYPAIKFKTVREDSFTFAEAFNVYGNGKFENFLKEVKKVSDNVIYINDGEESMMDVMLAKSGKLLNLPIANGFINNPIYHIRMWLVDREISKYESLKEKKRLIELRLMELKLNSEGTSDPELRKQIEYYENKLSRLEYNIAKIETSN